MATLTSTSTTGITQLRYNSGALNTPASINLSVAPNMTGIYFTANWNQSNTVAGALTEYLNLSDLNEVVALTSNGFTGAGNSNNIAMCIYYDVAASYDRTSNTAAGYLARYAAGATVVVTRNSSGTWAIPLADTKVDGYVSDTTNFPSSKSAIVLNGGVPAFRFIGRTSAPADSNMSWSIQGFISISE